MPTLLKSLSGTGFFARVARGSAFTASGYAASQLLRLLANLLLTRILYPEAFGLMALVSVFMVGLVMFSDVGIGPAISQNRRGDDPDFLDTAWSIQVIRGVLMFVAASALAFPVAWFYDAPMLAQLLPVASLTLVIAGFYPTRIETANRHLMLGRVTLLDLASQAVGTLSMLAIAWQTQSVWALVVGGLIGAVAKLWLMHRFLPGAANRPRWEPDAVAELLRFGKWIYLSTACGFLIQQGDKAILGAYLPLATLGIYNIGFFLATFPLMMGQAVTGRILIPIYRENPPAQSDANFRRLRRMRVGITSVLLGLLSVLSFVGVPLVDLLYGPRYAAAGPMLVMIACVQMPVVIGMTYDASALAAGDSRNYFYVMASRTALTTLALLVGAHFGGLTGALTAQGLALCLGHLLTIWLARRHGAWDALHDCAFGLCAALVVLAAFSVNAAALHAIVGM